MTKTEMFVSATALAVAVAYLYRIWQQGRQADDRERIL